MIRTLSAAELQIGHIVRFGERDYLITNNTRVSSVGYGFSAVGVDDPGETHSWGCPSHATYPCVFNDEPRSYNAIKATEIQVGDVLALPMGDVTVTAVSVPSPGSFALVHVTYTHDGKPIPRCYGPNVTVLRRARNNQA